MGTEKSGVAARFFVAWYWTEDPGEYRLDVVESVDKLTNLFVPVLSALGYDLVRVHLVGGPSRTLQVMAERRDRRAMSVDDCAEISRTLSAILDVEDPINGHYSLEISSPGIDRPLVCEGDYNRFAGFEAKLETARPVGKRRKFRGHLVGVENGIVAIRCADGEHGVPFSEISRAKLILTDELIAATNKMEL